MSRPIPSAGPRRPTGAPGASASPEAAVRRAPRRGRRLLALLLAVVVLAIAIAASLALGVRQLDPAAVWQALVAPVPGDRAHEIVLELRVPRTLIGLLAGVAFALSGALIQGVTRNPIADPGLLGLNSGASLAVVLSIQVLGISSPIGYVWFAFGGAAVAAALVFAIGSARPDRLALVGAATTALLTPLITLVLLGDQQTFDQFRFWVVGSLTGRDLATAQVLWPFVAVGVVLAFALSHRLNGLALGDDVARGLGQRVGTTRALAAIAIVLLAGTATALAGPIVLIGLVVPHAARRLVGSDTRWVVAISLVLGPALLLAADVIGRLVAWPGELEAGVVAALIGAPVLIAVARSRSLAGV
ncbi:FecCD family ABC transporter permease [Agromyces sp. MMS24-K17]|uniref:FecCD family ABC transporter permease n=1 Tax=Agromyces sp. MMS24-K17 TaxID=3372850 RepID=UPI0037553455